MSSAIGLTIAILLAGLANAVIYLLIGLLLIPFVGVSVPRAALGFGPRLFAFPFRGTSVEVRLVPLQSYFVPAGGNPYADEPPPEAPWLTWRAASRWRRVLAFVVAPRAALLLLPFAFLGPGRAGRAVIRGTSEVFAAFGGGGAVLESGARVLAREGLLVLTALAVCKVVAFSVVLVPPELAFALERGAHDSVQAKTLAKIRAVVLLATMVLYGAWIVAWLRWLL